MPITQGSYWHACSDATALLSFPQATSEGDISTVEDALLITKANKDIRNVMIVIRIDDDLQHMVWFFHSFAFRLLNVDTMKCYLCCCCCCCCLQQTVADLIDRFANTGAAAVTIIGGIPSGGAMRSTHFSGTEILLLEAPHREFFITINSAIFSQFFCCLFVRLFLAQFTNALHSFIPKTCTDSLLSNEIMHKASHATQTSLKLNVAHATFVTIKSDFVEKNNNQSIGGHLHALFVIVVVFAVLVCLICCWVNSPASLASHDAERSRVR
jgi:hypothetical protein